MTRTRLEQYLIWIMVAAGIITRLAQYLYNRSLWLDEAFLVDNLLNHSFVELTQRLDHGQGAPIAFLLAQKLLITLFGSSEYVLRFLPLLAGILSVLLLWRLCEKIMPQATLLTLVMFVASNMMIYYASEVKQYSSDVTITLMLYVVTLYVLDDLSSRRLAIFAAVGAVSVWLSHPALFILAGIGTVLLLRELFSNLKLRTSMPVGAGLRPAPTSSDNITGDAARRPYTFDVRWRQFMQLILVCAVWALSFIAAYFLLYRDLTQVGELRRFWDGAFLRAEAEWLVKVPLEPFILIAGLKNIGLVVVILAGFVIGLRQIDKLHLALLFAPMAFLLAASALEQYPYTGRFIIFLLPAFMMVSACGLREILDTIAEKQRSIAYALTALFIIIFFVRVNVRIETNEVREMLAYIDAHKAPDDLVVMHYRTAIIADYYQYDYIALKTIDEPLTQPAWFGYLIDFDNAQEDRLRHALVVDGEQIEMQEFTGVRAYYFQPG